MPRPAFAVRLRLLPSTESGRSTPVQSNCRACFDVGNSSHGEPMLNDGRILFAAGEVAPGDETNATLEPLRAEYWGHVKPGMTIPVMDGPRVIGHATVQECVWPAAFTSAVAAFVRAAYDFRAFVEAAEKLSLQERLTGARDHLLALCATGGHLPDVDSVTDRQAPTYPTPNGWGGFEAHEDYRKVFDPYEDHEVVGGFLSDDILDVYRDVRRGLWFWEEGELGDAVWEWRYRFQIHWGDHALNALRALHHALRAL